jgi:hypothetical protein
MKWLVSLLGGGIADQLRRAYEAKLAATNDTDRIAADVAIARLQNKLATSDNIGMRWAIGIIGLSMALHLAAVVFVSVFPFWGWTVHALPAPMNEWQSQIILGLFGLSAIFRVMGA